LNLGGIVKGHRIGYIRVSSFEIPERQLEHAEVHKVFTDKAFGKSTLSRSDFTGDSIL
jgi:hypothetical protein